MADPDRWVLGFGRPSHGATGGGRTMSPSRRQQTSQRRRKVANGALREDRAAVSDVLGSLLLVGITVMAAVGFGILLLSFDGPENQLHADLELRTDPGTGGWETGDESVQIIHLGGEDVPADGVTIRFTVDATTYCFGDSAGCLPLGSAWADGALSIGETWEAPTVPPLNLAADTGVDIVVVLTGVLSQVLASGLVSGSGDATTVSCVLDTSAPTGSFSHIDLKTTDRTTPFQVVLQAADLCGEVDTAVLPTLFYRVTPALAGVPSSFSDAAADLGDMPFVAGSGFVLSIPPPPGAFGWASAYGRTVEWFASGLTDDAVPANTGDTAIDSELIQVIGASAAAPASVTLTAGAFTTAGPQANLNTNNGANALLQEACMLEQPVPIFNTQDLCGTVADGSGTFSDASNALFSDGSHSSHSGTDSYVEVSGFDVPAATGDLTGLSIVWEGRRSGSGSTPTVAIEYNFGTDYGPTSTDWTLAGSLTPGGGDSTTTLPVLLGGPWSADQFNNLHVRARISDTGTRTVETDAFYIIVTYDSSPTVRDLDAQFNWNLGSLAAGSAIRELQIEYFVATGETYTVEVFNGSAWDACAGSLTATTIAAYTCNLTEAQVTQGPLARVRGAATSDTTTPSILALDYVHVLVVQ